MCQDSKISVQETVDSTVLFSRNVPGSTSLLARAKIGIAGCGGLGSNVAVSLVRAGIGTLILVDNDRVELSNLNRQHYFLSDIGKVKVDALAYHLRSINPNVNLHTIQKRIGPQDVVELFQETDLLIEAFDKADSKVWLIETWCSAFPQKPIVCASGISGLGNTEEIKVRSSAHLFIVGDGMTDMSQGLCSSRVAIAAAMQANIAIELLVKKGK